MIVAASSNNQAVTNIIDAFGKDFGKGEGPFAGRWLPEVESFGMFLASHSRRLEAARRYQTEEFQTERETVAYVQRAKEAYLQAAKDAFPAMPNPDVASVVSALQERMASEVEKLSRIDSAAKVLPTIQGSGSAGRLAPVGKLSGLTASAGPADAEVFGEAARVFQEIAESAKRTRKVPARV